MKGIDFYVFLLHSAKLKKALGVTCQELVQLQTEALMGNTKPLDDDFDENNSCYESEDVE